MERTERRGSRPGEKRGDHSPEHLCESRIVEACEESLWRSVQNTTGDAYERAKIVNVRKRLEAAEVSLAAARVELAELWHYQETVEDPNHEAQQALNGRTLELVRRLSELIEARTLARAREIGRALLAEWQSEGIYQEPATPRDHHPVEDLTEQGQVPHPIRDPAEHGERDSPTVRKLVVAR